MTLRARVALQRDTFALDVDLTIANETVALIGPNGAGKTSLLGAVAGLLAVDDGLITLDGETLLDTQHGVQRPPQQRRVGVVFQDHLLFPNRTALDNVAYGLRARGAPRGPARAAAAEWLERTGVAARAAARPAELSGGEAQRVALARALATQPRALLLDEPLAALDAGTRHDIRRLLRRHLQDIGVPAIVVTHDPVDAAALAERIVVIEDGRITHDGSLDEITRHPRSAWVAGLAGMNLYRGTARGGVLELARGRLVLQEPAAGEVFACIAPSAVTLSRARADLAGGNVWPARIDGTDSLADRVRVHLRGEPDITAEMTPAAAARLDLAGPADVWVSVEPSAIATYTT